MHLVKRELWATIDLDVTNGHVFVRQDWTYEWIAPKGLGSTHFMVGNAEKSFRRTHLGV